MITTTLSPLFFSKEHLTRTSSFRLSRQRKAKDNKGQPHNPLPHLSPKHLLLLHSSFIITSVPSRKSVTFMEIMVTLLEIVGNLRRHRRRKRRRQQRIEQRGSRVQRRLRFRKNLLEMQVSSLHPLPIPPLITIIGMQTQGPLLI